jgi:transposase
MQGGRSDYPHPPSWLRGELKALYSDIGQPSICPELMIRMLLLGYCTSILSERRLCQEVKLRFANRSFALLPAVNALNKTLHRILQLLGQENHITAGVFAQSGP